MSQPTLCREHNESGSCVHKKWPAESCGQVLCYGGWGVAKLGCGDRHTYNKQYHNISKTVQSVHILSLDLKYQNAVYCCPLTLIIFRQRTAYTHMISKLVITRNMLEYKEEKLMHGRLVLVCTVTEYLATILSLCWWQDGAWGAVPSNNHILTNKKLQM